MAAIHTTLLPITDSDLDPCGELRPSAVARMFQQAAVEASSAAGYDAAWYQTAGTMWIVRRTFLDCLEAVGAGEPVEIRTWIADMRRVRSLRRYEIRRRGSEDVLVRGHTDWVYLDTKRGRPGRVPEAMIRHLLGEGPVEDVPRSPLRLGDPPPSAFRAMRTVDYRDLDGFAHVNNANYLDYAVEAFLDALAAAGWPLGRQLESGGFWRVRRHDVEYFQEARYRDELSCATWIGERNDPGVEWLCEIRRGSAVVAAVRSESEWTGLESRRGAPLPASLKDALTSLGND